MSHILVLGSTGTVGAHLSHLLVSQGHRVKGATRSDTAHSVDGVDGVRFDFADPDTFATALKGVDGLFVLSPGGHADAYSLIKPFLDAASQSSSLKRIVTMTAQGVDFSDEIPLRKLELAVEATGKTFVHLRPSWFNQNFHTYWGHGIREYDAITLPAEDAKVAFIDARDIAASAAAALTRDDIELNRAYVLTGPEALSHGEAAGILSEVLRRDITYTSIDDEAFRAQLQPSGLPQDYIELLVNLFAAVRMGTAAGVVDSVETLTGEPHRTLMHYAKDHSAELGK